MRCFAVAVALVVLDSATLAGAGNNPIHKVAVHLKSHPTSCTVDYPAFPHCVSIQHTYDGCGDVDVLPVFYDIEEIKSVEFGLAWWINPSLSMVWTRCQGDAAVGLIAHSGDGTVITWNTCQQTHSVAPGYGWLLVSGPEIVYPDRNPVTLRCGVTDCQASPGPYFDASTQHSSGGICGMVGDDPCTPVGNEVSTWGTIKALLR